MKVILLKYKIAIFHIIKFILPQHMSREMYWQINQKLTSATTSPLTSTILNAALLANPTIQYLSYPTVILQDTSPISILQYFFT
jgi:hypothetical protein